MKLVVETLERLVGFDTVCETSNLAMIDFIEAFCRQRGAETTRIPDAGRERCGLVARFGPGDSGGIALSGHTDVVPVEGQEWLHPAFELTCDGDRLFGRGTTDMKGFLACMLDAGDMASRRQLTKPLTLVFSYDEEIGCVGIQRMRPKLGELLGEPRLCIVGEPTEMQLAIGHKGKAALVAHCNGQSGHSALAPHLANALHLASDFIAELRQLQAWFEEHGARDTAYDIPYTTVHAGTIEGGTSLNMVPERARIGFEYRYLPADGKEAVLARVREAAEAAARRHRERWAGAAIELECRNAYPGLEVDSSGDAAQFAREIWPGCGVTKVAFGTEAGVFSEIGVPTVVCGPGSMSAQGHKPDEYIEIAQLRSCKAMLEGVVKRLS